MLAALLFAAQVHAAPDMTVPEISVFGATQKSSPLDVIPTASELSGARLQRKRQSTVGETLANETGVSSSQFGPNASRPVIRGQDGDRIRVLQNGVGVLDASAASPDHAVALDPLTVEKFEIVRGAAALLYGPSATGGVVNVVTNRIPEKVPDGSEGRAEMRGSSTDGGRSAGFSLQAPVKGGWVVHADGALRAADDYHVPGYARVPVVRDQAALSPEDKGRVYNTYSRAATGAAGISYVWEDGSIGTSFSDYETTYGAPAERAVHINLIQQRWDLGAEVRNSGWFKSIRAKNSFSHYKHDEMEDGALATTFKNEGDEARVEARHYRLAGFDGVIGLQANTFTFSAVGEESFLPTTDNQTVSLFVFEERAEGKWRPSFGARGDASSVASREAAKFGAAESKRFNGGSFSAGILYQLHPEYALVLNGAYTERAPNYQELFADGAHAATGTFELGDRNLRKERGASLELSLRHKSVSSTTHANFFIQDFRDYIALTPTGDFDDDDPDSSGFPIHEYRATEARLYGFELEHRMDLGAVAAGALELELKLDTLRGLNRRTGENLPRITPIRESIGFVYKRASWQADLQVQRSEAQTQIAPEETSTRGYTLLNLGVEIPLRTRSADYGFFARVNNILDEEARNHVSLMKDIAPLPGRNFIAGVQAAF